MAIGDRNKKGHPTDKVTHYVTNVQEGPKCKTKNWEAGSKVLEDITCLKCKKIYYANPIINDNS